jgi:hypothetical protein
MSDRGLSGNDYIFGSSVPEWLPLPIRRWLLDLTYAEWHMMVLGLIGFPIGAVWVTSSTIIRTIIVVASFVVAILILYRVGKLTSTGALLSRETWYFVAPFTLFALIGSFMAVIINV